MVDAIFADPRLAAVYDRLEPDRPDLDAYLAIVEEFRATSVLDVGCGTGTFACLLAARDVQVIGLDPAEASVQAARRKPGAERVCWIEGDASVLPRVTVDLATMTGNVAQAFLADGAWAGTLAAIYQVLRPGGRLVLETRNPARQAWLGWTRAQTERSADIPGVGSVRTWTELVEVSQPLVSFRQTFVFQSDGSMLTSDSTLRFRTRAEIEESLRAAGYYVEDVRDAPDRSGLEFVFIGQHPE